MVVFSLLLLLLFFVNMIHYRLVHLTALNPKELVYDKVVVGRLRRLVVYVPSYKTYRRVFEDGSLDKLCLARYVKHTKLLVHLWSCIVIVKISVRSSQGQDPCIKSLKTKPRGVRCREDYLVL